VSEDLHFCRTMRAHGLEIHVDWDVPLMHRSSSLATFMGQTVKA